MKKTLYEKEKSLNLTLREFRKRAGLTQKEMAKRIGISAIQAFQIEKGVRSPRIATVCAWLRQCKAELVITETHIKETDIDMHSGAVTEQIKNALLRGEIIHSDAPEWESKLDRD